MKIYNTLTRQKEEFVPLKEKEVGIYACGPTVYNFIHIGNARPLIVFDTLRRYLEYKGYKVTFVQNITDIDDRMIKTANELGITVKELADRYSAEYMKDYDGFGAKRATVHPKATEHIDGMIEMIEKLVEKGMAYIAENGDVYYDTKKFRDYGKLSHQPLDELEAGARVEVNELKRDPMDFALWKAKKPGEPSWSSPWGEGRPGWHIECSVMSSKYLGETFDIHGGGSDLMFPHHENEIAQSEGAAGKTFARYWMHNAFLNINNEKMSKSLGNFITARDAAEKYGYEVIRFFMLSVHYRNPINFSEESVEHAKNGLERLYNSVNNLKYLKENARTLELKSDENGIIAEIDKQIFNFNEAMDDDLNTADAISSLFEMVKEINTNINADSSRQLVEYALDRIIELTSVLGIMQNDEKDELEKEVEELINKRQEARKNKDWAMADKIRDELKDKGIIIEDTPQGVRWKRER